MAYRVGQVVVTNSKSYVTQSTDGTYLMPSTLPNNVLDTIHERFGVYRLSHFGVQARPGAIFAIDDEVIVIGRGGSYELAVDLVSVDKLYMLSADTFIIDFRY